MRILFILDPLDKLHPRLDSSLSLLREFHSRGNECWGADVLDLGLSRGFMTAHASRIIPGPEYTYDYCPEPLKKAEEFDLIVVRKEPPVDSNYIYMTHLLERVPAKVVVSNDPKGIRNTNEKLGTLLFPEWIPASLVTSSLEDILHFQEQLDRDIVIKPLDQKGGYGIVRVKKSDPQTREIIRRATKDGKESVLVQRFLNAPGVLGDKRILVLDGNIIAAYEKRFAPDDFRANISLGASYHSTRISDKEKELVKALKPYLAEQGLHLVGLDVMMNYLLDLNVTCPAGLAEAEELDATERPVAAWADFLEQLVKSRSDQCSSHHQECNPDKPKPALQPL